MQVMDFKEKPEPDVVSVGKNRRREGYGHLVDLWSAGVIMLEFIFGRLDHAGIDHLPLVDWIKACSDIVVKEVAELDENSVQVIEIPKYMLTMKPEDRFTADECLQRGCDNALFRRLSDGRIVDSGDSSEHDANEVAPDADVADDSGPDDGTTTPIRQLPQRTESGTANASKAPTILLEDLWDDDESDRHKSVNGQLAPTRGSNSGPSTRRLKTSHQSWRHTHMRVLLHNVHFIPDSLQPTDFI
jgi:serine/threonine protein kinase